MLFQTTITHSDDGIAEIARHDPQFRAAALDYQPVSVLASGVVCGLEAVWRRAEAGFDERMLAHACVEARYWPGLRMSLKISARQLESGGLLGEIEWALAMSGLPASQLELELAETVGVERAAPRLLALRQRGVGIVLGAFGSGGSSLLLLRHLPLAAVKLDRRLVHALPLDAKACARARLLLDAARVAGLRSIADGLETLAQRDFLIRNGADEAQGPLYSRPLAPERLAVLLDYGVDTCSLPRSGSETRNDRAVPH
jgi:EAL domain-containing protein (putative c-di-GMP-specific phosphodiesterase class I)